MPDLKDVPPVFQHVFKTAWEFGFIQGGNATREQVAALIRSYLDLMDTDLITARDAFGLVIDVLCDTDETTKGILARFAEKS